MKEDIDSRIIQDRKLILQYRFTGKLGKGGFGQVYECFNLKTHQTCALKLEYHTKRQQSNLLKQYQILNKLGGVTSVPKVYSFRKWSYGYALEMEKMGHSLEYQLNKKIRFHEIKNIAIELLLILKKIHLKGIIHQDLKPNNIVRTQQGSLAIIDFGLSRQIKQDKNQSKQRIGFLGTPRYASLAAHQQKIQTAKDDIQSLLYVLGYMYTKKAPWSKVSMTRKNRLQIIYKYKMLKNKQWLSSCGKPFLHSYNYIQQLQPQAQVDYGYIIKLFQYHRQSLIVNPNKTPKNAKKRMSTYVDSPFIINIQQVKKQPTLQHQKHQQSQDSDQKSTVNQINQLNNFSTQVFENYFIERAISMLTLSNMGEKQLDQKLFGTFQKVEKQNYQPNIDQPSPQSIMSFNFPVFRNPFRNSCS